MSLVEPNWIQVNWGKANHWDKFRIVPKEKISVQNRMPSIEIFKVDGNACLSCGRIFAINPCHEKSQINNIALSSWI